MSLVSRIGPRRYSKNKVTTQGAPGFYGCPGRVESAHLIELLVTCPNFPEGRPNGVALARMARTKRPGIKVLFVGPAELEQYAVGLQSKR